MYSKLKIIQSLTQASIIANTVRNLICAYLFAESISSRECMSRILYFVAGARVR